MKLLAALAALTVLAGCGASATPLAAPTTPAAPTTRATTHTPRTTAAVPTAPVTSADVGTGQGVTSTRVTLTGTLIVVPGNGEDDHCLALRTDRGAYTVVSMNERYDSMLSANAGGGFDRATSGIHLHGAPSERFLFTLGDRVTITGEMDGSTSYSCSRYRDLGIVSVSRP